MSPLQISKMRTQKFWNNKSILLLRGDNIPVVKIHFLFWIYSWKFNNQLISKSINRFSGNFSFNMKLREGVAASELSLGGKRKQSRWSSAQEKGVFPGPEHLGVWEAPPEVWPHLSPPDWDTNPEVEVPFWGYEEIREKGTAQCASKR